MLKNNGFYIYKGSVKICISSINDNYCALTIHLNRNSFQTFLTIVRSIDLTYELLCKLFLWSLFKCIIRLISTFHFIMQDVPQRYYSLEKTVSHLFTSCKGLIVQTRCSFHDLLYGQFLN